MDASRLSAVYYRKKAGWGFYFYQRAFESKWRTPGAFEFTSKLDMKMKYVNKLKKIEQFNSTIHLTRYRLWLIRASQIRLCARSRFYTTRTSSRPSDCRPYGEIGLLSEILIFPEPSCNINTRIQLYRIKFRSV